MIQCPRCGAPVIPRYHGDDHAQHTASWLRWAATITHQYTCSACRTSAELVEIVGVSDGAGGTTLTRLESREKAQARRPGTRTAHIIRLPDRTRLAPC